VDVIVGKGVVELLERPDPGPLLRLDEGSEDGNDPEPTSMEAIKINMEMI
jgi:hypothetical protein